jgi:hypothetical protein
MTWFKVQARVEHISTGTFKAMAFAIPREIESLGSTTEHVEHIAGTDDEATRAAVSLASSLTRALLMRGDSVDSLEIV